MSNKKEKEEARLQRKKEKEFDSACQKLHYFPCISIGILIVVLLLFFSTWAEIYNTDIKGAEVSISGWNCIASIVTGKYTSAKTSYGDMAVPFYYYAESYCEKLSLFTLISMILILITIVVQVVTAIKKVHVLNYLSIILNISSIVFLFICFTSVLSMKESRILPIYCGGNPACSIKSYAIIPALAIMVALVINTIAAVKYFIARRILK